EERPQPVRALPVEIEMARDGDGDAERDAAPRHGLRHAGAAAPPSDRQPGERRDRDDLHDGADERVGDAAMLDEERGAPAPRARVDQELGRVGRVGGDGADPGGGRHLPPPDGAADRGADEGMCEVIHATARSSASRADAGETALAPASYTRGAELAGRW